MARMDYEKRRRKQIVDERHPLPWWRGSWGPTTHPDPTPWRAPAKASTRASARAAQAKRRALVARLEALSVELEDSRGGGGRGSRTGFAPGARFAYRNSRSRVSQHTIVRVADGRAHTHDKKTWKVRTLETLSRRANPVVELL
jgi:hypothetical protein